MHMIRLALKILTVQFFCSCLLMIGWLLVNAPEEVVSEELTIDRLLREEKEENLSGELDEYSHLKKNNVVHPERNQIEAEIEQADMELAEGRKKQIITVDPSDEDDPLQARIQQLQQEDSNSSDE